MEKIYGASAQIVNDVIILAKQDMNSIYEFSLSDNEAYFVDFFDDENNSDTLYSAAHKYNNKIFFIPWNADKVAIYDYDTKKVKYINCILEKQKYVDIKVNNNIYLVSIDDSGMYILDMELEEIRKCEIYDSDDALRFYHRRCCKDNNELILLPGKENVQYSVTLKDYVVRKKILPFNVGKYSKCVDYNNKKIYLPFDLSVEVIVYDDSQNTYEKIKLANRKGSICSVASIIRDNNLLIMPVYGHYAYLIDMSNGDVEERDICSQYNLNAEDIGIQNIIETEECFYATSDRVPVIIKINKDNLLNWEISEIVTKENEKKKRIKKIIEHKGGRLYQNIESKSLVMNEDTYGLEMLLARMYQSST